MDVSKLDVNKVNIRCSNCGSMSRWCDSCKGFKCKKCNTVTTTKGVTVKGKKGGGCAGCGKKKK